MRATTLLLAVLTIFCALPASAGRIVVNHDEWTVSNTGFTQAGSANVTAFVENVANFFTGGAAGNFLIYSTDFSLNESAFATAMVSAGHTLTFDTALTFDLPTLSVYDAIYVTGQPGADTTVLTDYVNAGGGVYLGAGTFLGGNSAIGEAAAWNPFLNNFGLGLAGVAYNGISGNIAPSGGHPIVDGVSSLYYNNGNSVVLFGGNPNAQIIETSASGAGLLGVYDDITDVPEPSTWLLMISGVTAIGFIKRRKS